MRLTKDRDSAYEEISTSRRAATLAATVLALTLTACGGGGGGGGGGAGDGGADSAASSPGSDVVNNPTDFGSGAGDGGNGGATGGDSGAGDAGNGGSGGNDSTGGSDDSGGGTSNDGDAGGDSGETGDVAGTGVLERSQRVTWSVGVDGGLPSWRVSASVTDYGAVAGDGRDDSDAFQAAIDDAPANSAVRVPAGDYDLNDGLSMRSGIVLRGDGADSTELHVNHGGHAIVFDGGYAGTPVRATGGYDKGSTSLAVEDGSQFQAGGYAVLRQENDPEVMYTEESWNVSWAEDAVGQVLRITGVDGNTLRLADPINLDFDAALDPQVQPLSMIRRAGLESLHIRRDNSSDSYMVLIEQGAGVWLRDVISERAAKAHVQLIRSYRCEVRGSYFNDASSVGGGGFGYGVVLSDQTSGSLVENNIFRRLRHAMLLARGASGNVVGYNYSREARSEEGFLPPDISVHGHYPFSNLFEGNVVQRVYSADHWGPSGPWNTFLRNRVESSDLAVGDHSDFQNIVGNEIANGGLEIDGSVERDTLVLHRNRVNGSVSGGDGTPVPDSYYRSEKPAFYGDMAWPSVGPLIAGGTNPAKRRYGNGDYTQ